MTALLLLALLGPERCYDVGFWLAGCEKHVLRLSACEQWVERVCAVTGRGIRSPTRLNEIAAALVTVVSQY